MAAASIRRLILEVAGGGEKVGARGFARAWGTSVVERKEGWMDDRGESGKVRRT